jgi:DegV family protein with EDD domain
MAAHPSASRVILCQAVPMTIHVVTDSSHYLDPAIIAQLNLHVLPLSLHISQRDFREREEITTEALFAMLADKASSWPTTAAVTPGALQTAFDALTAGGDEVVGIFMSRGTSVTVENAQNVAAAHPAHERIHIVDSLAISGALALTLHTAGRLAQCGASAAQIAAVARRMGEAMRVMFTVDTLDYLHRGGRMKGSQALLGSLLGIKPVLCLNKGQIELWSRARARRRRLAAMLDECVQAMPAGEPVHALIFHAAATEEAEEMTVALRSRLPVEQLYRAQIGPVVAAHVGPGCLAIAVCPASATR